MRQTIALNFDWFFKPEFHKEDITTFDLSTYQKVAIPHTVKEIPFQYFDETTYQFESSYIKSFSVEKALEGKIIQIRFQGVMTSCDVYVNQTLIGTHEGGYIPFVFDISKHVHFDQENILFVKVDSHEIKNVPPFGYVVDYLTYGGIYREVTLEIREQTHIEFLEIDTLEGPNLLENEMDLDVLPKLNQPLPYPYEFKVTLFDHNQEKTVSSVVIQDDLEGKVHLTVAEIKRWTLDEPYLYHLQVELIQNNQVLDSKTERFGFRTLQFSPEGFVLNNRKIKLMGLNRHQSYPYVGYAMPKSMQVRDADILKYDLGCNIVRTSHYMQSDHFIRRCDEIGLLVLEEIPGWQYIGDDHFKELSVLNLTQMIKHHRNHPCIALWALRINEGPDDHDFYTKMNEVAFELDPFRQTGGIRNFKNSELLEDVYTYNDFSHVGNNPGIENPRKVSPKIVPYLVTEHNGHIFPTKKWDPESKRTEQAMRHMKVIDTAFSYQSCSGAIGWCMSDYNTHKDFGSGDRICHHGVLDMFRLPKYAASVYAAQQTKKPVLDVLSNMNIGEYPQSILPPTVIFTNCDYIKVYHNGEYIDKYYTDWETYPDIPNAPIIITDYIGERLIEQENLKRKVSNRIKQVLKAYSEYGTKFPLKYVLKMVNLMLFHKISVKRITDIYGKYYGGWGKDASTYHYEGYINDELVISKTRGQTKQSLLKVDYEPRVLEHHETYDVQQINLHLTDEFGNDYPFAQNVVSIQTSKGLEVIGPKSVALMAGSIGFYVKTTGLQKKADVTFLAEGFEPIKLNIEIDIK